MNASGLLPTALARDDAVSMYRPGMAGFDRCMGLLAAALLMTACGDQIANADSAIPADTAPTVFAAEGPAAMISLTGTRLTQGNAVDCPQLQDDAGVVHVVSYLSPAIAIGARVTVTGDYGITTTCLGTVLVVQSESIPPD